MDKRQNYRSKILNYLSDVRIATRNEIMRATGITGKTLTKMLSQLVEDGVIELISENPYTYRFVNRNLIQVDFNEIANYYDLKLFIFKELKNAGWRLSPNHHEVAAIALLYSKYTAFRVLVFGSQGIGKTSLIKSVFGKLETPLIIEDLHLKNMYEVVSTIKDSTKVIEQQYRHHWGYESPAKFDKYRVVPLARIGPSEFIFRFVPVRVIQPTTPSERLFNQVFFEFLNVPKPVMPSPKVMSKLESELKEYEFFTIDNDSHSQVADMIKYDEMVNFTDDTSAEFYRINAKYDAKKQNDFYLANWKELWEINSLYQDFRSDLQLWNNMLEVLRFNLAWLNDTEKAVEQTVDFILDMFRTFTLVRER